MQWQAAWGRLERLWEDHASNPASATGGLHFLLKGFPRLCRISSAVWGLDAVSFFTPFTLQMSGLFLFPFISAYRPANSLLSSSPYNNSSAKTANKIQHILQIVSFLDSSSRVASLRENLTLLSSHRQRLYHASPPNAMGLIFLDAGSSIPAIHCLTTKPLPYILGFY